MEVLVRRSFPLPSVSLSEYWSYPVHVGWPDLVDVFMKWLSIFPIIVLLGKLPPFKG
jgi:hypothetical protein